MIFDKVSLHEKWEKKRDEQFLSLLEFDPSAKVIDLGCGKGDFSIKVKEKIGCNKIYGMDIWKEGLKAAKKKGIKTIRHGLNKDLPLDDETFNVVVSNQVLEHLWYPLLFLKNIKRITKSGGYAVISTENLSSWDNVIALLFGYTPFSMQFDNYMKIGNPISPHEGKKFVKYPTHTRVFTYYGLKSFLEFKLNLTIESIKSAGYLPFEFISKIDARHSRFLTVKFRK